MESVIHIDVTLKGSQCRSGIMSAKVKVHRIGKKVLNQLCMDDSLIERFAPLVPNVAAKQHEYDN